MVSNEELWQMYDNHVCIKNCKDCPLFLTNRNECIYVADEKLEKWQKQQHQEFQKYIKAYEG